MARLFSLGLDNVPKRVSISSSIFLAAFAHEIGSAKGGQQHDAAAHRAVGVEVVRIAVVRQERCSSTRGPVASTIVLFVIHIATAEEAAFLCVEAEYQSEDDCDC